MKQLIDGLVYDTETATKICTLIGGKDFEIPLARWSGELYKTVNGRYFIAGEGGSLTMFAKPSRGGAVGGEGIVPLTQEHAYELAEQHMSAEDVIAHFPDMIQQA